VSDPFEALREKYVEMRAMRVEHLEGDDSDARSRMRALAARFPGALREIDTLPIAVIERRIAVLEAGSRPGWAETQVAYHAWMRVVLRIKREHGRDADPAAVIEWLRAHHRPSEGEPLLEDLDVEAITTLLRPPSGRITNWVLERIAHARGLTVEAVSAQLFDTTIA